MLRKKTLSLLIGCFTLAAVTQTFTPASAQRAGQFESELQSAMRSEAQAKATNTVEAWDAAGQTWMAQGTYVSQNENHKDWVKDTYNPATRSLSVGILKRAIACFIKAYELEGVHDTPRSRARSTPINYLQQAYTTLQRVDPSNADWPYLKGETLCSQGMYKQGTPDLKKAVALGGASGAKASALIAHTKPYLAHQLANDAVLWKHNEAVDQYNAAHYHPSTSTGHGVNWSDIYCRTRDYQASHPNASPGEHY